MANALVNKIAGFFKVSTADDQAVMVGTDDQALPPVNQTTEEGEAQPRHRSAFCLDDDADRRNAYAESRIIDNNVPEMSRALTIIATNATAGDRGGSSGFKLDYDSSTKQQDRGIVGGCLLVRLAMQKRIYSVIRGANKLGDYIAEPVYDQQGLIVRLKYLMPDLTTRVHDAYDRHVGFVYKGYEGDAQKLAWWQAIHLRRDLEDGRHYGRSLFAGGGRGLAQRLIAVRDALTIETLNRAAARNAFMIGYPLRMTDEARDDWVDDLKDEITREPVIEDNLGTANLYRQAQSRLAQQDILLPYAVDLEGRGNEPKVAALASAPIGDIKGVAEHFQDLTFVITGVPKAFYGIERAGEGQGSTRLDKQDIQFARQLRREQEDACWFLHEIVRRQYIVLQRPLAEEAYTIKMPDLREVDRKLRAEIRKLQMEATQIAVLSGLPARWIWMDVVFDGDYDACDQAAKLMGIDLDAPFVTAEQATALANRGANVAGTADAGMTAKALDAVKERGHLIRAMLQEIVPHVWVGNPRFTVS